MRKYILILTVILISFTTANAQGYGQGQGGGKAREVRDAEIQSLKVAFMTETLALTPSESEKFWPIYNQYWGERVKLADQKRVLFMKIDRATATQADVDSIIKIAESEAAIMSKFASDASRVISVNKVAKTFIAEDKFKRELLHKMRNQK